MILYVCLAIWFYFFLSIALKQMKYQNYVIEKKNEMKMLNDGINKWIEQQQRATGEADKHNYAL